MRKPSTRIFISKHTGTITAICDDIIDNIPDLGPRTITRQANVEFNPKLEAWEITDMSGQHLGKANKRAEAIQLEIDMVNERLKQKIREG